MSLMMSITKIAKCLKFTHLYGFVKEHWQSKNKNHRIIMGNSGNFHIEIKLQAIFKDLQFQPPAQFYPWT